MDTRKGRESLEQVPVISLDGLGKCVMKQKTLAY